VQKGRNHTLYLMHRPFLTCNKITECRIALANIDTTSLKQDTHHPLCTFADVRAQPCTEPAWFCHTIGTWNDGINKGLITLWPRHLRYLNAKEGLWKLKYFTMQKYNLQKKTSQTNQYPSRHYNSIITNLKFQLKPKFHLSKILI
jgi:hypothetical protein